MKNKILNIAVYLLLASVVLASCSRNRQAAEVPSPLKATLTVSFNPIVDGDNKEMINTIRFIVFDKASSAYPKLDVNKYHALPTPQAATSITTTLLEVSAGSDKMVVVIINEPPQNSYNPEFSLDGITDSWSLEDLTFNIAKILNTAGDKVTAASGMPMIGVVRDISVAAEATVNVPMVVERSVARVDIYLEAIDGGAGTGYTSSNSKVTLHNISYESYLVNGNVDNETRDNSDDTKNYGKVMKNVTALSDKQWTSIQTASWSYSSTSGAENRRLLCSFYTGERVFASDFSDRLAVSMEGIKKGGGVTGISNKVIETVSGNGLTNAPFTEIRRNNVYEITAKVNAAVPIEFESSVQSWIPLNVDVDIPIR